MLKHTIRIIAVTTMLSLAFLMTTRPAQASGYAIVEQSVSGMGDAYAGSVASPEDASTIFYNPAGLTEVDGRQYLLGFHGIVPSFRFKDGGSGYPAAGGMPLTGNDGGNGGEPALVPNAYYAQKLSEDLHLGIGLTSPYGLETEYPADWKGRYHGVKTRLHSINLNPVLAWKVNEDLSVGAGVSASYIDAELTSAVDFGGILAGQGVGGVAPQMLDGMAKLEGDDVAYGFNLGVLYKLSEKTSLGLNYRSEINHELKGDATFEVPAPAVGLQAAGMFVDTPASADLDLPQTASLGCAQKVNDKWMVLVDLTWTDWSCFEELRVDYDSAQPDSVTEEHWDDTWRCSVGVNYFYSEKCVLRAGTAYDETPIPDAQHRTPRIPDGDRIWFTLGAGIRAAESCMIDVGYMHVFFNDTDVDIIGATGDNLVGTYGGHVDIASIQATWNF